MVSFSKMALKWGNFQGLLNECLDCALQTQTSFRSFLLMLHHSILFCVWSLFPTALLFGRAQLLLYNFLWHCGTCETITSFPVSASTAWTRPVTVTLPMAMPLTWPMPLTEAMSSLAREKRMLDWGWGPPSDVICQQEVEQTLICIKGHIMY